MPSAARGTAHWTALTKYEAPYALRRFPLTLPPEYCAWRGIEHARLCWLSLSLACDIVLSYVIYNGA